MKIRLLITLLILFAYGPAMAQRGKASTDSFKDKELTPVEMQSDFRYLRAALEETHPGLYRYNSKEGMAREMDSLYALLDKPMKYYDFYRILTVLIADIRCELIPESDGTFTVKEQYNSTLARQYPEKNRFTGKIYFLVNGGSASTTAEFAAVAHSHGLGVFVGEETAGNYTGDNGGEFIALTLPKTGIQVQIPLLYYDNAVRPPAREGRGTIPDYVVPYNIKDVLSGTDTQLNFVYGLIRKMH